jgi:capsular exopolysaccharide synthesis family protein
VPYKTFDKKLVAADHMQNFVDESYRSLRAKILLSLHNEKNKRILVTSLGIGEGKSFTAANIAITLAQQQIRTLLIDGDLRRGIQHVNFGLNKKPGLTSILTETLPLDITQMQHFLQKTHINNLTVLGSGGAIHNSAEILNSLKFRELLQLLSGEFEAIILDTPPVAVTTDAIGIQDAFHKYIFVVKAAHTNITELNRKIREFPGLNKKVMGIVLNGAPYKQTEYYQYSSYKYVLD